MAQLSALAQDGAKFTLVRAETLKPPADPASPPSSSP
jgi:hypothetical protein